MNKRKVFDGILNATTYLFSSFGVIILIFIFYFIFSIGFQNLSFDILVSDYYSETYTLKYDKEYIGEFTYECGDDEYFSSNWGIALKDSENMEGEEVVEISYIDNNSPLTKMTNVSNNNYHSLTVGEYIYKVIFNDSNGNVIAAISSNKAEEMIKSFDKGVKITNMSVEYKGGGIRGSLVATFYLIILTLIIALPLGIGAAIYLSLYAKENNLTKILKSLINMTSGVPSIIFGLVGLIVFVPLFNNLIGSEGKSILAGALTMTIMLLPIIINTTKEAFDVVPRSLQSASLALGANMTQTTFKIMLPNALPGILTATLLSIGRIIGESAALIFVMGVQVADDVKINGEATTLATHIWSIMGGENPNYKLACAIAIVILVFVLVLNIIVKIIGKKLNKLEVK